MQSNKERSLKTKKQGSYILYLRARQNLSVRAFADKVGITPAELTDIENGNIEASEDLIRRLVPMSNDQDMDKVFEERFWEALKRS